MWLYATVRPFIPRLTTEWLITTPDFPTRDPLRGANWCKDQWKVRQEIKNKGNRRSKPRHKQHECLLRKDLWISGEETTILQLTSKSFPEVRFIWLKQITLFGKNGHHTHGQVIFWPSLYSGQISLSWRWSLWREIIVYTGSIRYCFLRDIYDPFSILLKCFQWFCHFIHH